MRRGRPLARKADCRPNRPATFACHCGAPKGWPQTRLLRIASSSAAIIGRLTRSTQSGGRSTGHALSSGALATAGRSSGEPPQATPWPVLGPRYHTSPQGVALHVPPDRDEVPVVPDREGLEAALVEVPRARRMAVAMPALGVRQRQPLHEPGELPIDPGPEDQVEVVGQHFVGHEPYVVPRDRLGQGAVKGRIIILVREDGEPGIGPVQGMIDQSAFGSTKRIYHVVSMTRSEQTVNRFLSPSLIRRLVRGPSPCPTQGRVVTGDPHRIVLNRSTQQGKCITRRPCTPIPRL